MAAWECSCKGKSECKIGTLFSGNDDLDKKSPGQSSDTSGVDGKFLYYERDYFNQLKYTDQCWNHIKTNARDFDPKEPDYNLVVMAKCKSQEIEYAGFKYTKENAAVLVVLFDLFTVIVILIFGWIMKHS